MAKVDTLRQEWWASQSAYKSAVQAAGLEKAFADLQERNAYIREADEHFRDERALVFSVPDVESRKRLIHCARECERLMRAVDEEELHEYRAQAREGGHKIRSSALWWAAGGGGLAVYVLGQAWGVTAAIAGATAAVILGFQSIRNAETQAAQIVEQAKRDAAEKVELIADLGTRLSYSETEERTGLPDG